MADRLCRPFGRVAVDVGSPDGPGWAPFPRLAERAEVALAHARATEDNGIRPKTAAMWLATYVTSSVMALYLRAHYIDDVLLDLPLASLRVHRDPGRSIDRVAVPPDAGIRSVAADVRQAALAEVVVEGMRPFLDALRGRVRIGRRALWGAVGDGMAAEVMHVLAAADGRDAEVVADFTRICAAAGPMKSCPAFTPLDGEDGPVFVPARAVCCSANRGDPGRCATCPDFKPPERLARLLARDDIDGGGTIGVFGAGGG